MFSMEDQEGSGESFNPDSREAAHPFACGSVRLLLAGNSLIRALDALGVPNHIHKFASFIGDAVVAAEPDLL